MFPDLGSSFLGLKCLLTKEMGKLIMLQVGFLFCGEATALKIVGCYVGIWND